MKKRGFTLIEIIICVLLLAIIGTVSLLGIRIFNKNKTLDKLDQITDKVLMAAEVYIETNGEAYNQLYKEKNGVVIPLNVLVNEGLLDLKGTSLERNDIEEEYVISALATTSSSSTSGCVDITTSTSWNLSSDNPIYICTNNSGGGSSGSSGSGGGNSIIIGGNTSNAESTKGERTYITDYTRNYVSYNSKNYRLLYVDYDDSLVLYTTENTFGDAFNNITQETASDQDNAASLTDLGIMHPVPNVNSSYCNRYDWCKKAKDYQYAIYTSSSACYNSTSSGSINNDVYNFYLTGSNYSYKSKYHSTVSNYIESGRWADIHGLAHKRLSKTNKEQYIGLLDFVSLASAAGANPTFIKYKKDLYMIDSLSIYSNPGCRTVGYLTGMKIQLRPCMKIGEGIGTSVNPYKLVNMC